MKDERRYHRPGQKWLCGNPILGQSCETGPDASGKCKNCTPIRSERYIKRLVFNCCSLLALGAVLLMLTGKYSNRALIPGPISPHHSSFSEDCSKCHQNDLKHLTIKISEDHSLKCVDCHKMGNFPKLPHGMIVESKNSPNQKTNTNILLASKLNNIFKNNNSLKCNECHTEHKGDKAINFDNNKCQICHQPKFTSFENNHPVFSNYPHRRRTRIIFDHDKHLKKYFKKNEIGCNSCHQVDHAGDKILTLDFKKTCSSCHLKEINGEGQAETGLAFISMPQLDLVSLGLSSGAWPVQADGELTPFLKIILSKDPEVASKLRLISNLDLTNLSQASVEQKNAVNKIISAIKSFYVELYTKGHLALRKKLEQSNFQDVDSLISGFPLSLFRKSLKDWLPGLLEPQSPAKNLDQVDQSSEELMQSGGWYRTNYSIYYRPRGHEDPFIRSWMELSRIIEKKETFGLKEKLFDPSTPGRCAYCHSVDQEIGVNWHSYKGSENVSLNWFKHGSHFLVMKNQGCTTCHALDPLANPLESYKQPDPNKFKSAFLSIDKTLCSDCHAKGKAGNNCLECHNYHLK